MACIGGCRAYLEEQPQSPFQPPPYFASLCNHTKQSTNGLIIWPGGPDEFVFCFTLFSIRRQVLHPPRGPWDHVPTLFGRIKAAQPPCKMRERMRQRCVLCVVKSAPLSQYVVSARSIVVNVRTPTLLGIALFVGHMRSDKHGRWIQLFCPLQRALWGRCAVPSGLLVGFL